MAENQITWKPWQVDTRKLKEESKTKGRPKNAAGAAGTSKRTWSGHGDKDMKEGKMEETIPAQVDNEGNEEVLGVTTEDPKWKNVGSAPSRGPRGYDAGSMNDSLFGGGGSRPIPDGLRRLAGGNGGSGGGDDDKEFGGETGGAGGGGGGGEDGGDDDKGGGDGEDSLVYAANNVLATTAMADEPPDAQRQATIKIKQGRFEEAQDLQLAILREESDARTAWTKLKEMVAAWSKMGENNEAQNLQLRYLKSNTSYSWRVERLEEMVKDWCLRERYDRAARLAGLYVNIYAHGSDEMASAVNYFIALTVTLKLSPWYVVSEELFGKVYSQLSSISAYTPQVQAAIIEQFSGMIADGKIEEARRLQHAHLSCLRSDRATFLTTTEIYIDRWLEMGNQDEAEGVLQEVMRRSWLKGISEDFSENLVAFFKIWAARGALDKGKALVSSWIPHVSLEYVETLERLGAFRLSSKRV